MANTYDGMKNTLFSAPRFEDTPPEKQVQVAGGFTPITSLLPQLSGVKVTCSSEPQGTQAPATPTQYWS